jgi:superfamily II RNA helicase
MRNRLLGEPTLRQSQTAISATTADMDNDQTNDQIMAVQTTTNKKSKNSSEQFHVHYTHERRFQTLKKDMHKVYDDIFQNTPAMYAKLVVGTRNRRDEKNELIRKRPARTLLRNTITQSKFHPEISFTKLFMDNN